MKVFKICFLDGCDRPYEVFDYIEIVLPSKLVRFVKDMIGNERICEQSVLDFNEKHGHGIRSIKDAIELLESDGYTIGHTEI